MASINMLVSEVAHALGQPNSKPLRENIKSIIIHTRNELIRQNYEKHGYADKVLNQRYRVTLQDVADGEIELPEDYDFVSEGLRIKKTSQKVPRPVRFNNNLPFMRVSTVGYKTNITFPFVKETNARFASNLPGMCGLPQYDYINDYIYIFNVDGKFHSLNQIIIESPFEHPSIVDRLNGNAGELDALYEDDNEWFLPEDMIGQIKDIIFKRELLNQVRETNEITGAEQVK